MTDDEFNRWCAETVMGWKDAHRSTWPPFYDEKGVQHHGWSPATDLNAMREVELKVIGDMDLQWAYNDAIMRAVRAEQFGAWQLSDYTTASCAQRKSAIEAIKDKIEATITA